MLHELKLIKIHKRRLQALELKSAKVGVQMDASVDMEIEDIKESIKELESTLKRILQPLKEKEAIYGINVDPSVTIQIEDIEGYFNDNHN